jgi:hypothetical protein
LGEWIDACTLPTLRHERQNEEATEAIRQMDTNALPYLLKWIQVETPSWKGELFRTVNFIGQGLFGRRCLGDTKQHRRARDAMRALVLLGSKGEGATTELCGVMNKPGAYAGAQPAVFVLACFGKPILFWNS